MPTEANQKRTLKERVLRELKEVLSIVLYLFACLSLLATFRDLVLAQHGINEFNHDYLVALVESLMLGKVAALAQNLRVLKAWDHRPLVWSVLFKAVLMTIILDVAGKIEHVLFLKHVSEAPIHPLILFISHQCALMGIFIILFVARDLNRVLGPPLLSNLFFRSREIVKAASPSGLE